jgi:coatomer subunit beta
MCLYAIFQHSGMEYVENSIDDIHCILLNEKDISTKRNAFILLFHIDQPKALGFLKTVFNNAEDPIGDLGDVF